MSQQEVDEATVSTQPALDRNGSSEGDQPLHLNPVWVQCCHPTCQKWRLLRDTFDAAEIPDNWFCDMNDDEHHNQCDQVEESWADESDDDHYGYLYTPFSNGSVVWAAADGFSAWWPAMIVPDPNDDLILQTVNSESVSVDSYHVVFFGRKPTRAWIYPSKVKAFGKFDPKTETVRDALVLRTLAQWNNVAMKEARQLAQQAFDVKNIQNRLRVFGHLSYFKRLAQPKDKLLALSQPAQPKHKSPTRSKPKQSKNKLTTLSQPKHKLATLSQPKHKSPTRCKPKQSKPKSPTLSQRTKKSKNKLSISSQPVIHRQPSFIQPPTVSQQPTVDHQPSFLQQSSVVQQKLPEQAVDQPVVLQEPEPILNLQPFFQLLQQPEPVDLHHPEPPTVDDQPSTLQQLPLSQPSRVLPLSQEVLLQSKTRSQPQTPIRTPFSALANINQEPDEIDKRTRAVCEEAAMRLDGFLNLSQEAMDTTVDEEEGENVRPLSQSSRGSREVTPRKTFTPLFKPLFSKIIR